MSFSEEELDDFRKQFDVFDQDRNGHITAQEVITERNTGIARDHKDNRYDTTANVDFHLLSQRTSYNGDLVWKITNYQRLFEEARSGKNPSLYSPPFFTSQRGYKMCGRVYPNGNGVGKGSHMSVFFVLMKGEYDGLLQWPFQQKVTLTLLDQSREGQHISDITIPDMPCSLSFLRPTSEFNLPSGCPRFVSLDVLRGDRHEYIKDDTIFIRIVGDTTGLTNS